MPNGNGNSTDLLNGLPWWAKFIVLVGVPSVIALGLVWSNQTQLATDVRLNGQVVREIQTEERAHDARVLTQFEALGDKADETNRILLAGCINDAQTKPNPIEARERCVGRR